ncbi:MAG: response regulator, partial [Hylemonella sp.]|nr:response regulator [Hylemonella sp.]
RIFQKFSQADSSDTREKGGTGLGLAITKELIERMGGTVGFDSVPGEGATFWAELPVHSPVLAPNGHAPIPQQFANADADAPSILVVEDDHEISHLLSLMLQRAGYHTAIAYSGEKALEMLESRQFSAMTLDLKLPGISGLEVIRRVRRNPATSDLPVIVISASVEHGRLSVDGEYTAVDWLSKPFDERHLLAMMEQRFPKLRPDHPQRVLHVEDDSDLHRVVRAMASGAFEFEHAANLAQARAMLAKTRFDVVILDQGLPDGSGLELLPLLRELSPTTRVVILSGSELEASHANEVQAYLLKSNISPQQLLDALSERLLPNKRVHDSQGASAAPTA